MPIDRVLLLDSTRPNTLAAVRSLGRKGVDVVAAGHTPRLPAMRSKYAAGSFVHRDPDENPDGFIEDLEAHLRANDYFAVMPITDRDHSLLSRHKERLEATATIVAVEDWPMFERANDKGRLFGELTDIGVPTPETRIPDSLSDVNLFADDLSYPVLIKPRLSSTWDDDDTHHNNRISGTNYASSPGELRRRYRGLVEGASVLRTRLPIVQEIIQGESMGTVALANEGDMQAVFQHRFVRTYPVDGGRGAVRVGTREPRMRTYAAQVIDALDWTGPIMVEFMRSTDGEFYLIEVNGRYWGSLPLTINSGVDIPWLHFLQLKGIDRRGPAMSEYRTDVYQRNLFWKDIGWLFQKFQRGEYAAIVPFLTAFATTRDEFFSLRDPGPSLGVLTLNSWLLATYIQDEKNRLRAAGA